MTQLKILVVGGGIAGNVVAFWLSRLGHSVTVIERHDSLRTSGLQIDLRGHGIEVLKRMGLEPNFRSRAAPEEGWQLVNSLGKRKAYFPANRSGKGSQSFTSDYEIMRGDFVQLLYEANKNRVKYLFGVSFESLVEKDAGFVEVRFTDTSTGQFNIVIGADGQWSRTRKVMLGSQVIDGFFPIPNKYVAYFTMPLPMQQGDQYLATTFLATGRRGMMTRRHNQNQVQVYLGCTCSSGPLSDARRGDIKVEKEAFKTIFRGAGWQTDKILRALEKADDFYCERLGLIKLPSWSKGCVVLVGDAAYCPSVNTGMGTTSGVVGAYILAGEINKHCANQSTEGGTSAGICDALRAYEAKFRPFMDQVQHGVIEEKDIFPSTSFGVAMFNCIAGIVSALKLSVPGFGLKEKVNNWDLPEYDHNLEKTP